MSIAAGPALPAGAAATYDVFFILNRFFAEMAEALRETTGYYSTFNGDGFMALYGISTDVAQGCRVATVRGRAQPVSYYAIDDTAVLAPLLRQAEERVRGGGTTVPAEAEIKPRGDGSVAETGQGHRR